MVIYLVLIIFFVISSGFFAGSESGFIASNKIKFKIYEEKGSSSAKLLLKIFEKPDQLLTSTLIGTNISVVSSSILLTYFLQQYFKYSPTTAALISTAILTPTFLIFAEIIPKSIFLANATSISLKLAYVIRFFMALFKPILIVITGISRLMLKLLGIKRTGKNFYINKDVILQIFQWGTTEGILEEEEKEFVYSILATHKTTAREIMVPLVNVISLEVNEDLSKLVDLVEENHFTRIPVYEERVDNIIGYVSCKDLIFSDKNDTIKEVMRDCVYIPETKAVDYLMVEMQKLRVPIVFVVDEYGGCSGILTNEDIAEEIVGEILEEDEVEDDVILNEDGSLLVKGQIDVDDLNYKYKLGIDKKGFETIAGFALYVLGKIPEEGEKFTYKNFKYCIKKANDKTIERILIKKEKK